MFTVRGVTSRTDTISSIESKKHFLTAENKSILLRSFHSISLSIGALRNTHRFAENFSS